MAVRNRGTPTQLIPHRKRPGRADGFRAKRKLLDILERAMAAHTNSLVHVPRARSGTDRATSSGALVAALTFLPRYFARWARCRCDLRDLSQMEDRLLQDIGISRSEIERAVFRGRS